MGLGFGFDGLELVLGLFPALTRARPEGQGVLGYQDRTVRAQRPTLPPSLTLTLTLTLTLILTLTLTLTMLLSLSLSQILSLSSSPAPEPNRRYRAGGAGRKGDWVMEP